MLPAVELIYTPVAPFTLTLLPVDDTITLPPEDVIFVFVAEETTTVPPIELMYVFAAVDDSDIGPLAVVMDTGAAALVASIETPCVPEIDNRAFGAEAVREPVLALSVVPVELIMLTP